MREAFLVDENNGKKYDLWEPRWCSEEKSPLSFSKTDGITPQSIKNSARSNYERSKLEGKICLKVYQDYLHYGHKTWLST